MILRGTSVYSDLQVHKVRQSNMNHLLFFVYKLVHIRLKVLLMVLNNSQRSLVSPQKKFQKNNKNWIFNDFLLLL